MRRPTIPARRFHYTTLTVITILAHTTTTLLATQIDTTRPRIGRDGVFFQYVGLAGQLPYRDIWDVKPPLIHAVSRGVGILAGDPATMHTYSVVLMAAVATTIPLLVARLTDAHTTDSLAAAVAGLAWLTFSTAVWLPARGLRPKAFVVMFGLGTLLAITHDRHLLAMAAAVLAAGFWQLAIIFPVVAFVAGQRDGWPTVRRQLLVAAGITIAVVSPYLRPGAIAPLVLQVVGGPLLTLPGESAGLVARVTDAHDMLGLGALAAILGGVGLIETRPWRGRCWPVGVVTAWYSLQVAVLDFDGPPDLVVVFACLCVGAGLFLASDRPRGTRKLAAGVALLAVVVAVVQGPAPGALDASDRVEAAYWSESRIGCHVQQSPPEQHYMRLYDETTACGPYGVEAVWRLVGWAVG